MKYKKRLLEEKLRKLGTVFPAIVLTGARQVGKSTLFKYLLPGAQQVIFDPTIDIGNARKDPELFLNHLQLPAILDEIQYAPELLSVIKRRIDEKKIPGQYWITGSQNLNVIKNISESLAGRAAVLSLYPMTLAERYDEASSWVVDYFKNPQQFLTKASTRIEQLLASVIWRGGYPGLIDLANELQSDALSSYLSTYIERDVRLLSEVSDLQEFSRFVQLVANLTAQEIHFTQLGREIGVSPQTAQRWLNLLKSTYQWIELPAYSGNTIKRISMKRKGYFIDTGLACHLMHISTPNALLGHPKLGALFETYVVNDILRQLPLLHGNPAIYHWRSHAGAEVDLLLEMDNMYYPIEIKCKTRPTKNDLRGIQAFRQTYPQLKLAPGLLICAIDKITPFADDCYAMPFDMLSSSYDMI
ncbi:MAG: GTP-binding protein [Gammaproteobacteria bacterium RIFCSPHIGHO2_12_FULL_37_34]|nr:MAG: GTP-binding protein [Gammaproteobacteria bacterium RIFCSPHIGHO2_12_FULL_37_34]